MAFACIAIASGSCSKDDGSDPGSSSRFKPSDFKISTIEMYVGERVDIAYEQLNTTTMDYDNDTDGTFRIKWAVKSTDGVQYQTDRLLATELDAGAAAALSCVIEFTNGKTIDESSLTYEVYFDH